MEEKKHNQPLSQPNPETLHTTDPQEHMEGPFSSSMQNIKETAEKEDVTTKQDTDNQRNDDNRQDRPEDRP